MSTEHPDNPVPPVAPPAADDRPHAPPTDDEAVYYSGSPLFGGKPEKVIGSALLGTVLLVSPILVRILSPSGHWPQAWAALTLLTLGVIFWIVPVIITKAVRYRISNYRIDFERGIVSKDISTVELWHVEDIAFHQSLIDRILGIGTIRVIAHDDTLPDFFMRGLPDARKIFEELKQRIIAVKRQSGVLKLDTGT